MPAANAMASIAFSWAKRSTTPSAVGGGVGELILRITGRKRGPKIEFLAGLSVVGGALLSLLIRHGTHLSCCSSSLDLWCRPPC